MQNHNGNWMWQSTSKLGYKASWLVLNFLPWITWCCSFLPSLSPALIPHWRKNFRNSSYCPPMLWALILWPHHPVPLTEVPSLCAVFWLSVCILSSPSPAMLKDVNLIIKLPVFCNVCQCWSPHMLSGAMMSDS